MIKIFLILVLFIVCSSANNEIKFGLLYGKIFNSKREARVGSNLWLNQIKEKYPNESFSIVFYENKRKLLNDYENKKIDVLVSNATFYLENKKFIDKLISEKWILSRSNNKFEQFYLIKNKNSKFNFTNLDIDVILYREEIGKLWFETLFKKNKKIIKKIERKFGTVEKSKRLVLNPFFKSDEIAIIGKDLFDSMLEINPQIHKQIEIIKKSKKIFFRGIGFTRKNISLKKKKLLRDMTTQINKINTNFEGISFIQIQSIYLLKKGDLEELYNFYDEYKSFKKSIN